jgi:hypothetical protein
MVVSGLQGRVASQERILKETAVHLMEFHDFMAFLFLFLFDFIFS